MAFADRVKIFIDVVSDGATRQVQGFRGAIADADGVAGKFRAGVGQLGTQLRAHAAPALLAAGAAAIGFAKHASDAFIDTAKGAIDLAAATGLTTEQASRWIAVGDDFQVSAEEIQGALGKVTKSLDAPKWAEYGIATRDAGGNARDTNAILLDTFDMLGKVTNETERSRIGADLFGKGYAAIAPMIGSTRAEYEDMLGSVEAGQVITAEEAAKAERLRLAHDALGDALNEVTMATGEFVAGMAPAITKVTEIASSIIGVTNAVSDFLFAAKPASSTAEAWWSSLTNPASMSRGDAVVGLMDRFNERLDNKSTADKARLGIEGFRRSLFDFGDETTGADMRFREFRATFEEVARVSPETAEQLLTDMGKLRTGTDDASLGFQEWAEYAGLTDERMIELATSIPATAGAIDDAGASADGAAGSFKRVDRSAADFTDEIRRAEQATRDMDDAYSDLTGELDQADAWADVQEAMWNYHADTDQSEQDTRDYIRALADMVMSLEGVPDETKTALIAQLDDGDIATVESYLNRWALGVNVPVKFKGQGDVGFMKNAEGTNFHPGGAMIVGDRPNGDMSAAELVVAPQGSRVLNASRTRQELAAGGAGAGVVVYSVDRSTTIIHQPPGLSPTSVNDAQRRFNRRNGVRS